MSCVCDDDVYETGVPGPSLQMVVVADFDDGEIWHEPWTVHGDGKFHADVVQDQA